MTTVIGVLVIMFKYSWLLSLVCIASMLPSILATRISLEFNRKYAMNYQKTKAEMCSQAEETLSNIRTVKAFGDEKQSDVKFRIESAKVFDWGNRKARIWGIFMGQN